MIVPAEIRKVAGIMAGTVRPACRADEIDERNGITIHWTPPPRPERTIREGALLLTEEEAWWRDWARAYWIDEKGKRQPCVWGGRAFGDYLRGKYRRSA